MDLVLRRIYLSVLVTAIFSLFLIGKLIDQVFDSQTIVFDQQDFIVEANLLKNIASQLELVKPAQLEAEVEKWSLTFNLQLELEQQQNVSLSTELADEINSEVGLVIDSEDNVEIIRSIKNHPNYLLTLTTQSKFAKTKDTNTELEIWLTILFYLSFCLILAVWAFPLAKRLSNLNRMASVFGAGDLTKRIKVSRFSYIKQLEVSFNRMANQIEDLIAENKLLAGSISHDLRTPLSCLRFGVDAALETNKEGKKDYYLTRMDEDLTRMESMLEAFLDYASLERKRFELVKTQVDIVDLIQSAAKGCEILAEKNGKEIKVDCHCQSDSSVVELDQGWFSRAITNLITNAINYSKSTVQISCRVNNNSLKIIIADDGEGVPEKDRDNVFRAFVKLDKSRTQRDNFGLGLAIVARVISWHEGKIELDHCENLGGAKFTVTLFR